MSVRKMIEGKVIESNFNEAEALTGSRLDRRRNFLIDGNSVFVLKNYVTTCSGCSDGDAVDIHKTHRVPKGGGCRECSGYGVRKRSYWSPYDQGSEL